MSLDPVLYYAMPEDTARIARAAFPKGNVYLRMHDALGPLYHNPSFAALFSARGRPAEAPARLALITIMQFAENLSDRQAAGRRVVRGRLRALRMTSRRGAGGTTVPGARPGAFPRGRGERTGVPSWAIMRAIAGGPAAA